MIGSVIRGLVSRSPAAACVGAAAWTAHVRLAAPGASTVSPDVMLFVAMARKDAWFETGCREPLHIWAERLLGSFVGYDHNFVRISGVMWSALAAAALCWLCLRHFGWIAAIVAVWAWTASAELTLYAQRGLRDEFLAALLLGHCSAVLGAWGRPGWHPWVAVSGAALCMARLPSLPFVALSGIAVWLSGGPRWRTFHRALFPVLLSLAVLSPYIAYCSRSLGNPMYAGNIHVRWYANREKGVQGYDGGPMSYGEYLGLRPARETAWRFRVGASRLYKADLCRKWLGDFYALHICALALALRDRRFALLAGMGLAFTAPTLVFAYDKDFDSRLFIPVFALMMAGAGAFVQRGLGCVRE